MKQSRVGDDLDRIAEKVVRFHCSVPAVFLLELGKPLAFLGSQMLVLSSPILNLFVSPDRLDRLSEGIASRDNWEALIRRIEKRTRSGEENPP
jgi:hypothetical protein